MDDYDACQRLAAAVHRLRWHGILAPAAGNHDVTLALLYDRLSAAEAPVPTNRRLWQHLPPDPRRLRVIDGATDRRRA